MPAEQIAEVFLDVIEGGKSVSESAEIIQFVADNGAAIAEGITETAAAGNGVAAEVTAVTETVSSATTTTGLGLLAIDVGVAGAAIAPALGILAGVGLYNLAPEFWTNVSNTLVEAGQTIGGKVHALLTDDGRVAYSKDTIEIFKQAFIDAGLFDKTIEVTEELINSMVGNAVNVADITISSFPTTSSDISTFYQMAQNANPSITVDDVTAIIAYYQEQYLPYVATGQLTCIYFKMESTSGYCQCFRWQNVEKCYIAIESDVYSIKPFVSAIELVNQTGFLFDSTRNPSSSQVRLTPNIIVDKPNFRDWGRRTSSGVIISNPHASGYNAWAGWIIAASILGQAISPLNKRGSVYFPNIGIEKFSSALQPNATYPTSDPFPQTYPEWQPINVPESLPQPNYYPVEIPYVLPDQEEAQDPVAQPEIDPDPWVRWIIENLPIPDPNPDPYPEPGPAPQPDPDPQPDPEPAPEPDPEPAEPNPPDPNEPVEPDPVPFIPPILDTVNSTKIFTVYNPTSAQLDALGAFLWSNDVLETIVKIWQNPLDGVISLRQVYCTLVTSGSHNIILGSLDSGVSAAVVTSQFTTIDCGSVTIGEKNKNVTDYSPYATVHLYLPFIGIVQLDVDEVMNSTLNVKYTIDVYTGTCLAEVYVTRSPDMTVSKILYTFSGNCSQALPLTASDATGLASTLASLGAAAIGIFAGGGGLGAVSGASMVGHSLTHEMINIGHSGSLSSNAGIMGQRKPYVIIGRRHGYDANSYNEIYGYPSNKTVFLSNCTGYVRVKAINLQSAATEEEKKEIIQLLKQGVIM